MPVVPPKTINDLPKAERKRFTELCYERSVLQYTFSFAKLLKALRNMDAACRFTDGELAEKIHDCIIAWNDKEAEDIKHRINDSITDIFTENGVEKTLRYVDPFGREKDYILMEGVSTSFAQARALPLAVAGVYEWKCPECGEHNFTPGLMDVFCSTQACAHFKHTAEALKADKKLKLSPLPRVKSLRLHNIAAEAIQSIFKLATNQTTYVTLQARDVKDDPPPKKK